MNIEYCIIPKDVICFKEEVAEGIKFIEIIDGKETVSDVINQNIIEEELLIEFSKDNFNVKISLVPITKEQIEVLQKQHRLFFSEYQILFKIEIESNIEEGIDYLTFDSELRKYLILAFILANKNINVYHYEYGKFTRTEADGQGIFLPYAFIKLTRDGLINLYYESSYEKMTYCHSYCRIEEDQISEMKRILKLFFIDGKRNIPQPVEEMFIHINTISWIISGFFYPALVTLFTCFESLLNKQPYQQIADLLSLETGTEEYDLFLDLQKFRNGIAHLESHKVYRNGRNYICEKTHNSSGSRLSTPVITTFDIDRLEKVREKLVELIIHKIEE
jgi:hypothetical protein